MHNKTLTKQKAKLRKMRGAMLQREFPPAVTGHVNVKKLHIHTHMTLGVSQS